MRYRFLTLTILSFVSTSEARQPCESMSQQLRTLAKAQTSLTDPLASSMDRYRVTSYIKQNRFKKFRPVVGPVERLNIGYDDGLQYRTVKAYDRAGRLARFEYSIDPKYPQSLSIDVIKVNVRGQNRGLSEAMFARVLNAHPEVTEIKSFLIGTNSDVIKRRLRAGLDCETAILGSPAGLMQMKFGFTRVISATCDLKGEGGRGTFTLIQGR